jgi:hypothetical protein
MTTITPSGIKTGYTTTIGGVLYDLGDLFAAPTTGTPATTNYQTAGIDLSSKFAHHSTSLSTPPFITGYKINGIDISQICILHPLTNVLNGTNITTTISGTTYTVNVPYSSSAPSFNFKLISPTVSGTLYGGQAGGGGGPSIPTTNFNTNPTTNTTVSIVTGSGGNGYMAAFTIPAPSPNPFNNPPTHIPAINASIGQATTITFNSASTPSYQTGTSLVINSSGTSNGASGHATLIFTPF